MNVSKGLLSGLAARFAHLVGPARRKAKERRAPVQTERAVKHERKAASRTRRPVVASSGDPRAEMQGDGPIADARRRERARCETIVRTGMAAGELDLAESIAFDTTESRRAATAFIKSRSEAPKKDRARTWSRALSLAAAGRTDTPKPDEWGWDEAFRFDKTRS